MEVYLGEKGLNKSWQKPFDKTIKCSLCGGKARIMFVGFEGRKNKNYVCNLRKNGGRGNYWVHDAIATAIYLCKDCFSAEVIINQA